MAQTNPFTIDPESYPIDVLHYLNPHLIWVERRDKKSIVFEQVGLFGLLPLTKVIDEYGEVVVKRSENWVLAIMAVMKEFFEEYKDLYFLPIHIDRRTSIFNENIHKFGDIYALTPKNEKKRLSTLMIDSGFAQQNECDFYEKLSSGIIKTKLSTAKSNEVINAINEHCTMKDDAAKKRALKNSTTITRAIKNIGTALTKKNLELHNRGQDLGQMRNISLMIEQKTRDLMMCKLDDESSLGRGCSRGSDIVSNGSKMSPIKEPYIPNDSQKSMLKMKKPLQKVNMVDLEEVCKKIEELSSRSLTRRLKIKKDKWHDENDSEIASTPRYNHSNDIFPVASSSLVDVDSNSMRGDESKRNTEVIKQDTDEEVLAEITKNARRITCPKKHFLAFGPPMNDIVNFKIKTSPIQPHEDTEKKVMKFKNDEEDQAWSDGEVDSNVNINITNIHELKKTVDSRFVKENESLNKLKDRLQSKVENEGFVKKIDIKNAVNNTGNMGTANTTKSINISDSFEELKHRLQTKVDSGQGFVNKFDSKVGVDNTDNMDKTNTTNSVNYSASFKKLKDRIISKNSNSSAVNKIYSKNLIANGDDNSVNKINSIDESENFKQLKNIIQLIDKATVIETDTGDSCSQNNTGTEQKLKTNSYLERVKKLKVISKQNIDDTNSNKDSDEEIEKIKEKLASEYGTLEFKPKNNQIQENTLKIERNVNPYKNLDGSKSVFVDKLVSPILMVHTKNNNLILPHSSLRDVPFRSEVKDSLKRLGVKEPSRLQSVSWTYIVKGHSLFMIGPAGSGKTLGYVPAVCNLVMDDLNEIISVGPICIIVCATAKSVCEVAKLCKLFLGIDEKVLSCYHGIDFAILTTSVLNGCDILICTPPMLCRLLITDLGVDLRRLSTLVFDDCERLYLVYEAELKTIQHYVKEMYKNRANKKFKVQYIISSRLWCDFMRPLARKAPNSIVSIVAFQECVLYSKASTSVEFFLKDNKVNSVKEFLNTIDRSKRTVIVCRTNDEVELLEQALSKNKSLFVCNNEMTIHDLYNLNVAWSSYKEPVFGPILVCCDGNLTHLNVTDAQYLIHFSLPELFSMFCKRFALLNDNYASIFSEPKNDVKIKILLDENNVEQLPKILNFIKRCTSDVPGALEDISRKVLERKDFEKGETLVPLCDSMLSLSECSDFWNCKERHAVLKQFDEPKDWIPKEGVITFKILHYDTAVTYSARLLKHIKTGTVKSYPKTYSMLSLRMGMYFSKESNRKLHGIPKIGDICAVAVKPNFYTRCQVIKILSYYKGNPHNVLINLIDEEQLETVRDVNLYHLPQEFKSIETHVVKVRLANVQPQDKDVTFSDLAKYHLKNIIDADEHLYLRGEVALTVGNIIFVNTLEACQDLVALDETVVKHNLKTELLQCHAKPNPEHINKLKKLCEVGGIEVEFEIPTLPEKVKKDRSYRWAYMPQDEVISVVFAGAYDPSKFFVVLTKFEKCVKLLLSDIQKYVEENPKRLDNFAINDVVLAEFPDDNTYERARIEEINGDKVLCFFVDRGDIRDVSINTLKYIPDHLIEQLPFQVIECRLIGLKPPGSKWTEFSINWLCDMCLEDKEDKVRIIYLKSFTKEKAEITGGNKYGVLLIDTNTDRELNINKMMIELNLASVIEEESKYLNEPLIQKSLVVNDLDDDATDISVKTQIPDDDKAIAPLKIKEDVPDNEVQPLKNILPGLPIKSVPLVDDNVCIDDWDVNFSADLTKAFALNNLINSKAFNGNDTSSTHSADESFNVNSGLPMIKANTDVNTTTVNDVNKIHFQNTNFTRESNHNSKSNINKLNKTYNNEEIYDLTQDVIGSSQPTAINTELETAENKLNTKDINETPKLIKRKGSLEDPKIVIDVEDFTLTKANVFKMFAKPKLGILPRNDIKIDDSKSKELDNKSRKSDLDSDDFSSTDISQEFDKKIEETKPPRTPKIIWRQNKNSVTMKIQLIGVQHYNLDIRERCLAFYCDHNDTIYDFKIELYGVINVKKSKHANKGQYIQVNLEKFLKKIWVNLTKDGKIKNWIVYDVDSIDTSSDEEVQSNGDDLKALKQQCEGNETDSDDDFDDDVSFTYEKHKRY